MTDREWHESNLAVQRQAREDKLAGERAWLRMGRERIERTLRAKFAAQAAAAQKKAPPPPANSGPGWRVLPTPRVPHVALEEHARAVWDFVWHSIDFPSGWRVRWGQLDSALLTVGGAADYCAARQLGTVFGLCVMSSKIILLSEENQQRRTAKQFGTTILHELVHVNVKSTVHGEQFQRALESATGYFFDTAAAPAIPRFMASASAPSPWMGSRFGPGRDPGLEYRG